MLVRGCLSAQALESGGRQSGVNWFDCALRAHGQGGRNPGLIDYGKVWGERGLDVVSG